nr:MarR family transcriptional regulator [Pseudomonas sp.]
MPASTASRPPDCDASVHYHGDRLVAEESMAYFIRQLYQSLQRTIDREMAPLDLTAMQWRPLALIAMNKADNPVELARRAGMDTGAMTRALDRLEAKGLVRRLRCHHDRRMVRLELTDEGRTQAERIPFALADAQNLHLRDVSPDELAGFLHLIRRMLANGAANG